MFRTISNFMRVAEIRRKILFTLAMLIVFRIGTFIPVPFTNGDVLKAQDQLNALGILNTFGGGALKTSPSLRWESCRILQHPSSCNYCRWMLFLNFGMGEAR